jgi:hypothetical protein
MTEQNSTTKDDKGDKFPFAGCEEMMKMMSRCMEGKGEKINFEQFCGKMSDFCREMMKKGTQS